MNAPALSQELLLQRLRPPAGRIRMVMDTDTYNEIDDQFAVVYALASEERLQVEAFYAAPFHNKLSNGPQDGMEKSYRELRNILSVAGSSLPAYPGSDRYLPDAATPVDSEAARDLVRRAAAADDQDPLYVVAIGAVTNVASAILMEPSIIGKIVVVWLGGHAFHWNHTREFNLRQDLHAARTVFDSGVPLVLVPCLGVASHLQTTLSEVREYVKDQGPVGEYLYNTYKNCSPDHFAYSRVIWDISAVAYLINDAWTPHCLTHSPRLSEDASWIRDTDRHLIRYVNHVQRDPIFRDLFGKLRRFGSSPR